MSENSSTQPKPADEGPSKTEGNVTPVSPSLLSNLQRFKFDSKPKFNLISTYQGSPNEPPGTRLLIRKLVLTAPTPISKLPIKTYSRLPSVSPQKSIPTSVIKSTLSASIETQTEPVALKLKGAAKRIIDSDSESDMKQPAKRDRPNIIRYSSSGPSTPDSKLKMSNASATNLEASINIMSKSFPTKDPMEIQDVLMRCKWNVKKAMNKLKTSIAGQASSSSSDDESTQKKWKRINKSSNSRKQVLKPIDVRDGFIVKPELIGSSNTNKLYNSNGFSGSPGKSNAVGMGSRALTKRQQVVQFMDKASLPELMTVQRCSQKKAEMIIEMRPFTLWSTMEQKFEEKGLSADNIFYDVLDVIKLRNEIANLMKSCSQLSQDMACKLRELFNPESSSEVSNIKVQPSILAPNLILAGYQMVGLNWFRLLHEQGVNGILADEMGLGKTVQVIAFLAYLKENKLTTGTHLVVVPSSTMDNWNIEFQRWCPSLSVVTYYGSQEERKEMRMAWYEGGMDGVDVLLTTYTQVGSTKEDRHLFKNISLQYIIYDEAHMLKNAMTQRYMSLIRIQADHRILLTGTPLQNNLVELMSLLIFVMPDMFAEKRDELTKLFKVCPKASSSNEVIQFEKDKVEQAKSIMEPFVLRRLKQDVLKDLPAKEEELISCEMIPEQVEIYSNLIKEFTKNVNKLDELEAESNKTNQQTKKEVDDDVAIDDTIDTDKIDEFEESGSKELTGMGMMMKLRRAANHPVLLRQHYQGKVLNKVARKLKTHPTYKNDKLEIIKEDLSLSSDHQIHMLCKSFKKTEDMILDKEVLLRCGKFIHLDRILPELKKEGHRVLIFSQFTQMLDVLEEYLNERGHTFLRLDGQTPVIERQDLVDEYNRDSSILVFLLSTRAGGLGINLTAADTVIIYDIDLNPYNDKQAEDRCHRVGQKKNVKVIKLVSKNTIEEAMLRVAKGKLNLEREVTGTTGSKQSESKKLLSLMREALTKDCKSEGPQ